jgi:hypothetical protein
MLRRFIAGRRTIHFAGRVHARRTLSVHQRSSAASILLSFTIVATGYNFGVDGVSGCDVASLNGMAIAITVETATGGAAPYPQLVTDDFERTFRLAFDTSTVPATTNDGVPCDFPLSAQVSLHLTQTAADYVYDPNAPCSCE